MLWLFKFISSLNPFIKHLELAGKISLQVRCGDLLYPSFSQKYFPALSQDAWSVVIKEGQTCINLVAKSHTGKSLLAAGVVHRLQWH